MNDHPHTIWDYSVNVAGSLIGIWLFVLLSAFSSAPVVWFLVAAGLLWFFLGRGRQRNLNVGLLGMTVLLSWLAGREPGAVEVAWSPYQKLALWQTGENEEVWAGHHLVAVNNSGYQGLIDLSPETVKATKRIEPEMRGLSQYDIPLLLHPIHPLLRVCETERPGAGRQPARGASWRDVAIGHLHRRHQGPALDCGGALHGGHADPPARAASRRDGGPSQIHAAAGRGTGRGGRRLTSRPVGRHP